MEFTGKVVWITGGANGIGKAAAQRFHTAGAKVFLTDTDAENGQAVARAIGKNVAFCMADMASEADLLAAGEALMNEFGRLDILFHAADKRIECQALPTRIEVGQEARFALPAVDIEKALAGGILKEDGFLENIRFNTFGPWHLSRIAAHYMCLNEPNEVGERGVMVYTTYMAANRCATLGINPGYAAGKGSIIGLARELAEAAGSAGLRFNVIVHGDIDAPVNAASPQTAEYLALGEEVNRWKRMFPIDGPKGTCDQVASMGEEIVKNWYMDRAVVQIDGGFMGFVC